MTGPLLITRPRHDVTTHYLSAWSKEIIDEASRKHVTVIDLKDDKATKERFIGTLIKSNPRLVVLNGHGDPSTVGGYEDHPVLDTGIKKEVKDKIIYARSCQSAKKLGGHTIKMGATAFVGYKENFVFVLETDKISNPLTDHTASLFLKPSNYFSISLMKAHSVSESHERSKNYFRKNMKDLLLRGSSTKDPSIRWLYWDMINQVCLGDASAKS